MGHASSKNPRLNKDHNKQKMLKIGVSVGRNDLNLEGNVQMGYTSKTLKNYKPIEEPNETTKRIEKSVEALTIEDQKDE